MLVDEEKRVCSFYSALLRPCASRPISVPNAYPHTCLYLGFIMRCLYSISSPVAPSKTAPANSHRNSIGYLRDAALLGLMSLLVDDISMVMSMISCDIDRPSRRERVLCAGA